LIKNVKEIHLQNINNMLGIFLALLSAAFAALVAIFGKIGLKGVDSTVATSLRAWVMAVAVFLLTLTVGKGNQLLTVKSADWLWILLSGLAGAASWVFYFAALKIAPANRVATIDRLSLVFVIILAAIFLGEKLTWKIVLGGLLMVGGAWLVVL
jgi:bacterial/archaeal transporter family protein